MNSPLSDQDVQQLYEAFSADHGLLREQLLARLKERAPEQTHRNAAPPAAWTRLRRSHHFVRRTAIVAGGMLAAIGLWLAIPLSTPAPVFGLEGLPERLVEVRSIHLRGKSHFSRRPGQETAPPPAVQEIYVARPFQSLRIHSENAAEGVRQIREVRDGKQRMKIDDLAKRVTLGKDLQTAAEYSVETFLQRGLFQQVLGSATTAGFAKLSTEAIDGVQTDVYERKFQYPDRDTRSRVVLWLDPQTGFPVQIHHFLTLSGEGEQLTNEWTHIAFNAEAPRGAFDFRPPADFTVENRDVTSDDIGTRIASYVEATETGQRAYQDLRFCFSLNDRAALVCWVRYNDLGRPREVEIDGPLGTPLKLIPTSSIGDRTFKHYFLRADADAAKNYHWRWSLVIPQGPERTLGDGELVFSVVEDEGIMCRGTLFGLPLRFPRDKMARWVKEAQRLTLPADAPDESVLSLDQLEILVESLAK